MAEFSIARWVLLNIWRRLIIICSTQMSKDKEMAEEQQWDSYHLEYAERTTVRRFVFIERLSGFYMHVAHMSIYIQITWEMESVQLGQECSLLGASRWILFTTFVLSCNIATEVVSPWSLYGGTFCCHGHWMDINRGKNCSLRCNAMKQFKTCRQCLGYKIGQEQ
jgi:hypothetical protein